MRALYTIGYEGRSLDEYMQELASAGVTLLCDVRRDPYSRKPGFSRKPLAAACEAQGIRYEHVPALGIPAEKRRNIRTQADQEALFAQYRRTTLVEQCAALDAIRQQAMSGLVVALTCYERSVEQCHRGCVADAIRSASEGVVEVRHL